MPRKNPNSSIRSGYAFEDLHVLKFSVEWLLNPDRFKQIRIQYTPPEVDSGRFFIDDVVVTLNNGCNSYYQIKYLQNPESDFWDFDKLFWKGLDKWISSVESLSKGTSQFFGSLISNGSPDSSIIGCIEEGRIVLKKVALLHTDVYKRLCDDHTTESLEFFFDNFEFIFLAPDKKQLEEQLRDILYHNLKVTKPGVDSLLLEIGRQGSERFPKVFTLADIRSHLSWDDPRPLNQSFAIPEDFEFFNAVEHKVLLRDLSNQNGGVKVIVGKPGTGKSTYLSKLYTVLKKNGNSFVARHHYHLNPKDGSFRDRLNSERAVEALRSEFKKLKSPVIEELSYQNTQHTPLKEFIQKIAAYFKSKGGVFVLIVDGLDHVVREGREEEELTDFLNEIIYPQPGFWLVLGTQEIAVPYLPNIVHRWAPRDKWLEIKGLNRKSVKHILLGFYKNLEKRDPHDIAVVVDNVYLKTQGNPLHLRYVLNQLPSDSIDTTSLSDMLPYTGEIQNYYEDLWRDLSPLAKTFALAITSLDFILQEEQLFSLAPYISGTPSQIPTAYSQIKHLIKIDLHGISVFHNSFLVFMKNQTDLSEQKFSLYASIRQWLRASKDEELRWSELAKIEYLLGDDSEILKIDRSWVIQSFLQCYDERQIVGLLELAAEAAYKAGNYKKLIEYDIIKLSFNNRSYNLHDEVDRIWSMAYVLNRKSEQRYPHFDSLEHFQLKDVLMELHDRGRINAIPDEAVDRFNDLMHDRDTDKSKIAYDWIELLGHFETEDFSRAFKFMTQFRDRQTKSAADYFVHYLNKSLQVGNNSKVLSVLRSRLTKLEKNHVFETLAIHELLSGSKVWDKQIHTSLKDIKQTNAVQLYSFLRLNKPPRVGKLSPSYSLPSKIEIHGRGENNITDLFKDNFFVALFLSLAKHKNNEVDLWIEHHDPRWQVRLMTQVLRISKSLAERFNAGRKYELAELVSFFDVLPNLDFYEHHDLFEYKRAVIPSLIKSICKVISMLNRHNGFETSVETLDLQKFIDSHWLYRDDIVDIAGFKYLVLPEPAYTMFSGYMIRDIEDVLTEFKNKANIYNNLTSQAYALKKLSDARNFLLKAAENIISYGNHKDMHLFRILHCIGYCGTAGSGKVRQYLRSIASYIYNIENFTDGDETGNFKYEFSELMARYDKNLLYNYYFESLECRKDYESETFFADILSCLDYKNPIHFAIGNTAVGKIPYREITNLAEKDTNAAEVVAAIHDVLGVIDHNELGRDSRPSREEPKVEGTYQSIPPENLANEFDNVTAERYSAKRYAQSEFLKSWCKYWFGKPDSEIRDLVATIRTIVEPRFKNIDYEILDFIYPFAFQTDREFAFQCLTWAHANSNSWGDDWIVPLNKSQKRWNIVLAHFPRRVDEFKKNSIFNSGRNYHREGGYFLPIPKFIQFSIDRNELVEAEKITEDCLATIPLLFPGVTLDTPDFIQNEQPIDEIEILLKRFEWLSPLVRERAGWQLAKLLANDESGAIHVRFLAWLKRVKLESFACYGLLIILKSLSEKGSNTFKHLRFDLHASSMTSVKCTGIDLLLTSIATQIGLEITLKPLTSPSLVFDQPELTEKRFRQKVGRYLQNVYVDRIDRLKDLTGLDVWIIWFNHFRVKCRDLGINETREDERTGNEEWNYITGRSNMLSEVLKSTFFTMLDGMYMKGLLQQSDLYFFSVSNLPVDISLWNIAISSMPEWWPKLKEVGAVSPVTDIQAVELQVSLEKIINQKREVSLLYLDGTIASDTPHYDNTIQCQIQVLPFGYRVLSADRPSDAELFQTVNRNMGYWIQPEKDIGTLSYFESDLLFSDPSPYHEIALKGLKLMPLVSDFRTVSTQMWQYYRMFSPINLLAPDLKGNLKLNRRNKLLEYYDGERKICTCIDFTLGVRDVSHIGEDVPCGSYVTINPEYLHAYLMKSKLRLAYVYRINYNTRKSASSDEFENYKVFGTVNLSRLII